MSTRRNRVDEAARRAQRRLDEVLGELRSARYAAGLSQAVVAAAIGYNRSLITAWERGTKMPDSIQLAQWGAVVGLDVGIRAFPAGSPLRDAGQLRLIARARAAIGEAWTWQTEVPVSRDPWERRAFDAVLSSPAGRVGMEAITRLTDTQAQVRAVSLKQEVAGVERMVLILADTRHNRQALAAGAPTIVPAFPLNTRATLAALREGRLPSANGIVLV